MRASRQSLAHWARAPQNLGLRAWVSGSLAVAMPRDGLAPHVSTLLSSIGASRNAMVPVCLSALGNTMTTQIFHQSGTASGDADVAFYGRTN